MAKKAAFIIESIGVTNEMMAQMQSSLDGTVAGDKV